MNRPLLLVAALTLAACSPVSGGEQASKKLFPSPTPTPSPILPFESDPTCGVAPGPAEAGAPPGRADPALAWDSARRRLVVFGGRTASRLLGDTWTWDGTRWAGAAGAGPSPRTGAAAAYDTVRQVIVLSGGETNDGSPLGFGPAADTWTWDGRAWARARPAHQPVLTGPVATFSPALGLTVMVGQHDLEFQAWTWDGGDWRQVPVPAGLARARPALGLDPVGGVVVLFGGQQDGRRLDDTWIFDAAGWRQAAAAARPPARSEGGLAAGAGNRKLALVGGATDAAPPCSTWSWDGAGWAETPASGKPNTTLPPVFDGSRVLALSVEVYRHEWVNRLWAWDLGPWKRVG